MLSLSFVFWMYVILFGIVGAMRGWAKELLVTFGVILAMFIITVIERFVPFIRDGLAGAPRFWFRTGILLALVFFGYQTPSLPRFAGSNRLARERLQDTLLGLFLGAVNGYLIFGTIWYYMHEAGYPFPYISGPIPGTPMGDAALELLPMLPPHWMGTPAVYFAVAVAFVFVLVVFI